MSMYTDIFLETLRTLDLNDLLSERDLELLRAAEAHHRSELLSEDRVVKDCDELQQNAGHDVQSKVKHLPL